MIKTRPSPPPPVSKKLTMSTNKTSSRKKNVTQSGAAMKPAFTDLRQNHETAEKLKRALKRMDKPTLEALVLNGVFPEVKSDIRHCVYCHQNFNTEDNRGGGCSVEHWREMEPTEPFEVGGGYEQMYLCCGRVMDYTDVYEHDTQPEDLQPYCYEGIHWDKEIMTDDEKEHTVEELGMLDDEGNKTRRAWWREFREGGYTCEKMQCADHSTWD